MFEKCNDVYNCRRAARERISDQRFQRDQHKLTYTAALDELPDGVIMLLGADDMPYLVRCDVLPPWIFEGYGRPIALLNATSQVLTPRSTVR